MHEVEQDILSTNGNLRLKLKNHDGWYGDQAFLKILKMERNRSNRTGLPISYVQVDLSNYFKINGNISGDEYESFLIRLLDVISDNTRDFDVKNLISNYKIGILLIDTSLDGAKAFIEKISRILYKHFDSLFKVEYMQIIRSILISSYPINQVNDCESIQATPIVVKNLNFMDDSEDGVKRKIYYKEDARVYMNWSVISNSNGAFSMKTLLFQDVFKGSRTQLFFHIAKRSLDLIGAFMGILCSLPIMIFMAAAIKVTSKGSVLFKQERLGQFGHSFTFLKFRTMYQNSDDEIHKEYTRKLIEGEDSEVNLGDGRNPLYKMTSDPRITPVGRFLRKTSLDELPQLFNVLSGQMSLVGPRPPIPYEVKNYRDWHLGRILEAKPGITGLWQVYGRSKTTFDEMVRLDLKYVEKRSLLLDILIILKTPLVVLSTKGAE